MTENLRTLVAIATYNEIENLPQLIAAVRQYAPDADILVTDDNSPDGTGRWCDEQAAIDPRLHVLHRPGKLGLGSAIVAGLKYAVENRYEFVVTMDADLSHDPRHLPEILAAMHDKSRPADVVIGSRYVAGGGIEGWPLYRKVMSRWVNWYARWILNLQPYDCSGAYRCYRVAKLEAINFDTIQSRGYSLLEEILWLLQCQGAIMREVPITFVDRASGKSKISYREAWQLFWILFRLRLQSSHHAPS